MKKQTKLFQLPGFSFLAALLISVGCNETKENTTMADAQWVCYQSTFERDTVTMKLDTGKQFYEGDMTIRYWSKNQRYVGSFRGEMMGDTLIGNFNFKINDLPTMYSNPVALLKKDGKLIMGAGEFETLLGRTYFNPKIPIDYSNSRFELEVVPCSE